MNDQRDAQILLYVFISIYNSPHVSSTQCSSSGGTIVSIQPLVSLCGGRDVCGLEEVFFQTAHISATTQTVTRGCIETTVSPDDEHCVLKTCRVVNRNKHTEENLCIMLVIHRESLYAARSKKK